MDLPRYVDTKLARGVLRQEMRGLRGGRAMHRISAEILDRRLMPTFRRGGKLSERDMDGVMADLAPRFRAAPTCLDVYLAKSRRPLTPSKAYRYVSGCFLDLAEAGVAHLTTVRVRVSPRGCHAAWSTTPFSFLEHAAERLLQRLPVDKPRDPLMTLGRAIQGSASLLVAALRPAFALPNRALAVPFGEGLLLGEVRVRPSTELACNGFEIDDGTIRPMGVACLNAALLPDGGTAGLDLGRNLHLVAKTYVGPRELRPEQVGFLARWNGFARDHGDVFASDGWMAMHAGCFPCEAMDAVLSGLRPTPGKDGFDAAYADLLAMFRDPSVLRAMGATGPPASEPAPFWEASMETNQRMREMPPHEAMMIARGLGTPSPAAGYHLAPRA